MHSKDIVYTVVCTHYTYNLRDNTKIFNFYFDRTLFSNSFRFIFLEIWCFSSKRKKYSKELLSKWQIFDIRIATIRPKIDYWIGKVPPKLSWMKIEMCVGGIVPARTSLKYDINKFCFAHYRVVSLRLMYCVWNRILFAYYRV